MQIGFTRQITGRTGKAVYNGLSVAAELELFLSAILQENRRKTDSGGKQSLQKVVIGYNKKEARLKHSFAQTFLQISCYLQKVLHNNHGTQTSAFF